MCASASQLRNGEAAHEQQWQLLRVILRLLGHTVIHIPYKCLCLLNIIIMEEGLTYSLKIGIAESLVMMKFAGASFVRARVIFTSLPCPLFFFFFFFFYKFVNIDNHFFLTLWNMSYPCLAHFSHALGYFCWLLMFKTLPFPWQGGHQCSLHSLINIDPLINIGIKFGYACYFLNLLIHLA